MPSELVNDIHLYYEIAGKGDPLVFIGGLGIDLSQYEGLTKELARHFTVIVFDNRGAGRSDKPDMPYSISLMAGDTFGLLQALGIRKAHVLGLSLGGRIALELTLEHPELVERLVLVSTSARVAPGRRRIILRALLRLPIMRTVDTRYPQPYYAAIRQLEASTGYDATGRLGEIQAPTLILHGKNDHTAPLSLAQEMHSAIRGSKLITFDGGHVFLFMRPKAFLDAVRDFLLAGPSISSPES